MRLFIAINFPPEIKANIAKIRNCLKENSLRGNFTFDENLHLTLVFLGECDSKELKTIIEILNNTNFQIFTLMFDKVGYFKRDSGNTWWIGLKENKILSDLQEDLTKRLIKSGFNLEDRKYTPHITIGREVKMTSGFTKPEAPPTSFSVENIDLMKSEHINGKLTYTKVYSKNF